jgi:N-acyl-D-amino-acid deacylase
MLPLPPLTSAARQISGGDEPVSAEKAIGRTTLELMQICGASSATVAVGRGDAIIYAEGFGFSDRRQVAPTQPAATLRIASCTKPVTRAAVEMLITRGQLDRETRIFDFLGIPPAGSETVDARVHQITIGHLLTHRGGWDRDATFDPLFHTDEIGSALKIPRVEKRHIVRYMWSQPLQFDPGEQVHYSNFGYLLLGLAIEKATGKSWIESVRELVAAPLGVEDFALSATTRAGRSPHEVDYPRESNINPRIRDSSDGLTTSATSLCKFMSAWWLDGIPRNDNRNVYLYHFGTHPFTTTAVMEQRLDGLNYALLFNARKEDSWSADNETIRARFNRLLDEVGHRLGDPVQPTR